MPVFLPAFFPSDRDSPGKRHPGAERNDPLPTRLFAALGAAIRDGKIREGEALPSTRQAAELLGLSRSTVTIAYDLLRAEGLIVMQPGKRPAICLPVARPSPERSSAAPALSRRGDRLSRDLRAQSYVTPQGRLSPGVPDETRFPADLWAQTLRRHARQAHGDEAGYGAYHGTRALREALSERLAQDRGCRIEPDQIVITPGTQASLSLIAQVMTDPGDYVAMEDPGYLGARASFIAAGNRILPVPIDHEGMMVEHLPDRARLVYITPSNQFPLGGRMGLSRRLALLEQARAQNALILEDDYDSEFLWHGREIASLAAHSRGTECLYLGSASKTLIPGLRLGWIAAPASLVAPLQAAHRTFGYAANLHAQLALASLMRSGQYRIHLRRIARIYQQRGLALYEALRCVDGVRVTPPYGGVQLGLSLTRTGYERACLDALAMAGYRAGGLSALCLKTSREGLIIGFATLRPDDPGRIAGILANCLRGPIRKERREGEIKEAGENDGTNATHE